MKKVENFDINLVQNNFLSDFYIEEEVDNGIEVAGTWGSAGTFGSSVGGCASTVGTASSFG